MVFSVPTERAAIATGNDLRGLGICHQQALAGIPETGFLLNTQSYVRLHCLPVVLRIEQYVEAMSSVQKLEQLSVKPKEIRLSVLQSELQETARLLALSKKVSVLVPSGGTVCIDHGLFLTVAENLIGNAARFAEKAISIQITLQNDSMTLNVEDDGAGYPLSLVQNGPTPFETTSSNSSHFGMGLYSSRILCEKHGGRLILENRAGGGASATAIFYFV